MIESVAAHLDAVAAMPAVWKIMLVFVFMAVESSFIPFPSEVVMIPAAFMCARGEMGAGPAASLSAVLAAGVLGSLAGAYVNYYLALRLGKPFLEKYGRYFFLDKDQLERACEVFNRYGSATTFVCRLVPVIRQLISIPAGIAKMPLVPFTVFTALGAFAWSAVLAAAGYAIGRTVAGDDYVAVVSKGAALAREHLPLAIGLAAAAVAAHLAFSRALRGKRRGNGKGRGSEDRCA
ncbi:MAG: DedA family protein [Kiritimatiellae bacterium]|nr:DedA family protein [Kiritimatiellia bacterium]